MAQFRAIEDTICAIATPPGFGGVSIIRVSGPSAVTITQKFCSFLPLSPESHRAYYGIFKKQPDRNQNSEIDEVVVTVFEKGRSFTGDQTCEISCHGSPAVTKIILENLLLEGCRLAEKGEFTYRAFMSGRIDLIQAESVLSLIQSESEKAQQMSLRQLKGELSEKISVLENKTTWLLANLEASIDFVNEGLDIIDQKKVSEELSFVLGEVKALIRSFQKSKFLVQGAKVSIVGKPNVGKSSVFNALIKKDKALVSAVPGTTRDVVEASVILNGAKITLFDTAGVHETAEELEQQGIKKTFEEIRESDLVLYVLDATEEKFVEDRALMAACENKKVIFVENKVDLLTERNRPDGLDGRLGRPMDGGSVGVSAKNKTGFDKLVSEIENFFEESFSENQPVLIQSRHFEILNKIEKSIERASSQLSSYHSPDLISFELKEAYLGFQELLGRSVDDQIMDRVFKEFCIGK